MLFNSYSFVFGFLPAVVAFHALASRFGEKARMGALVLASLVFYSFWDIRFVPLLLLSIGVNFGIGLRLQAAMDAGQLRLASMLRNAGVTLNLLALGYFKYSFFLASNLAVLTGWRLTFGHVILPLGISFFTFEQIAYLVDLRRGARFRATLLRYTLFVALFPRLAAGPILRYGEIAPQFERLRRHGHEWSDMVIGLTIFAIGLAKKAFLADNLAGFANPAFTIASAAAGQHLDLLAGWIGAFAYTLQLYFDFSGYSDMAIGAARMVGIRFPLNFNSPLKALSIVDVWRRWHMTLSRFLRDYLYIPLGGNRHGAARRYLNLIITMGLGGLWHGANWTFLIWGLLHGALLAQNHAWEALLARLPPALARPGPLRAVLVGGTLTFLAQVIAFTIFRAPDLTVAGHMLAAMAGAHGVALPEALAMRTGPAAPLLRHLGIVFDQSSGSNFLLAWVWITGGCLVAFLCPNTQQIMARFAPTLDSQAPAIGRHFTWRPSLPGLGFSALMLFLGILSISHVSEFLYLQF
jgi:D-alanyl-lipoteichoic acid acyltransferase DltB (MBOAT superfamily)